MKHVRNFEGFRSKPETDPINETVYQVENTYRVNVIVDVEAKLLSSYCKKVKQNLNKEIQDLMGNAMLAEELVKYVIKENLDADKIPASAIIGGAQGQGQGQAQAQGSQAQVQTGDMSVNAQGQLQDEGQAQSQDSQAQVQVSSAGGGDNLPI